MHIFIFFVVNGGWSEWSDWEACPVSCGGGNQTRVRKCDSPTPKVGGKHCSADGSTNIEILKCHEKPCPSTSESR